ncbi:MAG TPA: DinB family protein [Flavitalea sp.]|nr:DinB family protein [Flavitalea sp.]
MRKLTAFLLAFVLLSFISGDNTLSKKERKYAADLLKDTQTALAKSIEGLNADQLNYKASDSTWSVDGCVKHIAIVDKMLWGAVEDALQKPANPEKRADIKVTDVQLVGFIENRTQKIKTAEVMKPENSPFKTTEEALASVNESAKKIIDFVNTTNDDLRNHIVVLPFGTYDAYQVILIIGSHTNRHTQQIEEVKSHAAFPKS